MSKNQSTFNFLAQLRKGSKKIFSRWARPYKWDQAAINLTIWIPHFSSKISCKHVKSIRPHFCHKGKICFLVEINYQGQVNIHLHLEIIVFKVKRGRLILGPLAPQKKDLVELYRISCLLLDLVTTKQIQAQLVLNILQEGSGVGQWRSNLKCRVQYSRVAPYGH